MTQVARARTSRWLSRVSTTAAVITGLLVTGLPVLVLTAPPASAFDLPGDVGGHEHITTLLDVSDEQCGTLRRGAEDSGYMTDPGSYGYVMPSPKRTDSANAIDHHFIQDVGGTLADGLVWEMPGQTDTVDLFPSVDHGPVPGEAIESTVWGFDDLNAPASSWETGDISVVFDKGWSTWISDDYVTRWQFSKPHRYYAAHWGGPRALVSDDDVELDALCAPQIVPTGSRPAPTRRSTRATSCPSARVWSAGARPSAPTTGGPSRAPARPSP